MAPRNKLVQRLSDSGARFTSLPIGSKIALAFLLLVGIVALIAPLIAPHNPLATGLPAQPPGAEHLFGTDRLGRDILSRLLYGAQSSLLVGLGSVALALVAGGLLGSLAATGSKWANETIMRIMDMLMAFPGIALAAALLASLGNTLPVIIISIAVIYTPQIARVVRANVLAQWGEDYVRAERVIGAGRFTILLTHVVRNCAAPVLVFATVMVADAIILEASLSFLGAGIQDPAPSWGNVISYGRTLVLNGAWWATTFAGVTILLTVLALNILAEGMTDALVNVKGSAKKKAAGEEKAQVAKQAADTAETERLDAELAALARTEAARTDRLVLDTSSRVPRTILQVENLSIRFPQRYGDTPIVQNVSFAVREGETMALVGESGCGKSITSLAIMGLLGKSAKISGSIRFEGRELLPATADGGTLAGDDKVYQGLRGEQIAMVYQDALSSLNPSMLIGDQLRQLTRRGGRKSPAELLTLVKLDAARTMKSYPHELSGGQRQRVLIAMALSRSPKLVVCDEPTTALDVTVQKQVVDLLNELREQLGFAMVFVSHDLALVASLAHRVTVMYAGQVVESGPISDVLINPHHEYTRGLLGAVLSIESQASRLHQIPGTVPSPYDFADGDRFAERSQRVGADPQAHLAFVPVAPGSEHRWASHLPQPAASTPEQSGAAR
ncbi:dipeptide/oligopeptide/nickel ABC transporter permease/ATP-binding protein [Glutamicibacter nicotianae]|uniref:ABC transporter n=1 Tax=Glutamicibacter nicotianae TaxID=37929 RepID=A0ABQ0RGX2_GLUNI|nr:dipeptide/oligopeptide/nickel ABC transporter permease/ATP-binding protein [Glutamicibacter nicotianae]GEC11068.1 ABC transporter [Glutamicibacter nicotianae]